MSMTSSESLARRWNLPGPGVPFFAALVGAISSLNLVLFFLVPFGFVLELALLVWVGLVDRAAFNGKGRVVPAFRRAWWWESFRAYFPLTLRQETEFDATKRYLFVIHPHGIFGMSAWLSFAADALQISRKNKDLDIAIATVGINFYIPFWRDILLAVGFLDASFASLQAALRRNRSTAVVLGGAAEALYVHPGTHDIILNKRKGIIRLALTTGTPLVPVFVFGENDLFYQVANPDGSLLRKVQNQFLKLFRFSPPLAYGVGILGCPIGIMPRRVPMLLVTGTPIPVPQIESPSDADVLKYQAVYRAAILQLYKTHQRHYYETVLPPALRPATPPPLRIVE